VPFIAIKPWWVHAGGLKGSSTALD